MAAPWFVPEQAASNSWLLPSTRLRGDAVGVYFEVYGRGRRRDLQSQIDVEGHRALPLRLALAAPIAILACTARPDAPTDAPLQCRGPSTS